MNDISAHAFDVPSVVDEIPSEPLEQFRVRRGRSLLSKVFRTRDEAATEEIRPDAIYEHAGRERVMRIGKPLRQSEAVAWGPGGKWNEKLRKRVATDTICFGFCSIVTPPRKNKCGAGLREFLHYWYFVDGFFSIHHLMTDIAQLFCGIAGVSINCREIVGGQLSVM